MSRRRRPELPSAAGVATVRLIALCEKCGAEIIYGEIEGETVRVCSNCGELVEIVISDSTERGFDQEAYWR